VGQRILGSSDEPRWVNGEVLENLQKKRKELTPSEIRGGSPCRRGEEVSGSRPVLISDGSHSGGRTGGGEAALNSLRHQAGGVSRGWRKEATFTARYSGNTEKLEGGGEKIIREGACLHGKTTRAVGTKSPCHALWRYGDQL